MGNSLQKVEDKEENESRTFKREKDNVVFEIRKIYWDIDGNLRYGSTDRNRDEDVVNILQADSSDESDNTKLWMIIPSRWCRHWLKFTHLKMGPDPGPIDMASLLVRDSTAPNLGYRPKKDLIPPCTAFGKETPGHYRRVTLETWIKLVDLYGVNGYAIAVLGIPYDDKKRWRVFKDPKTIDKYSLPEPVIPEEKEEKKVEKKEQLITIKGISLF